MSTLRRCYGVPASVLQSAGVCEGVEGAVFTLVQSTPGQARNPLDGTLQERDGGGRRSIADDGSLMLGSKAYVEGMFQKYREIFGPQRKSGARGMREAAGGRLCTARQLAVRWVE